MGVLPDWMIERDVTITPFAPAEKREGRISFGVSSYGYDSRLGYKFRVFRVPTSSPAGVIDPKAFDPRMLEEVDLTPTPHHTCTEVDNYKPCPGCNPPPDHILIPPHSFVLAESLETFKIPRDVLCVVLGKSTYARCGLIVNVTPLEPEWEGVVTIELSNTTPLPMKVYPGEGIMQCLFFRSDGWGEWTRAILKSVWTSITKTVWPAPDKVAVSCRRSYGDKAGKYQNQGGLTLPTVDGGNKA